VESCLNQEGQIDQGVDWNAPWLDPVRELGTQIARSADWRGELNRLARIKSLLTLGRLQVTFAEQQELPPGESYEAYISVTGRVPTRDNLHDFFNALVWLTFPRIKAQLNALQAQQIAHLGVGKSRGPSRDAATLFDENAAVLTVTDTPEGRSIVDALRNHQWNRVFVQDRTQFKQHAGVFLFGHAIMEKLVRPYKAVTAHTLVCWVGDEFHSLPLVEKALFLDAQLALQLETQHLVPSAFSPLPVLGVPDWWSNQDPAFYADTNVFRPVRQR